jgi:hypothetical protein
MFEVSSLCFRVDACRALRLFHSLWRNAIKVSGSKDFPYVRLAAEVPSIGDWVLVVGNPFGLGGSRYRRR